MACGKSDNSLTIVHCTDIRQDYQAPVRLARKRINYALELGKGEWADLRRHNRKRPRNSLNGSPEQVSKWCGLRVEDQRYARDVRGRLLEGLQPLRPDRELETGEAGKMTTRVRQILH